MKKLENIKILFLTKRDDIVYYTFMDVFTKRVLKEGGTLLVDKYIDTEEYISDIVSKQYNIIIFDTEDNIDTARKIKCKYNDFASILYTEKQLDEILTMTIYNKFDAYIDPATIGCWATNGCEYSNIRIISVLLSAIKIHKLKYESIKNAIDKLVHIIAQKREYTLFNIIDSSGIVVAADEDAKILFGDIVGKNVSNIPHIYEDGEDTEEFRPLKEGDTLKILSVCGEYVNLKLVTQWVFENGQLFYIQMWENVDEVNRMHANIKAMDEISRQLKCITNKGIG